MAFLVSPGVLVQEIDATNVIPAVSSSTGAYVGHFRWGPAEEVRTVTSGKGLVDLFGEPDATDIAAGIKRAVTPNFRDELYGLVNPYGDGRSGPRIAAFLASVEIDDKLLHKKFVDR